MKRLVSPFVVTVLVVLLWPSQALSQFGLQAWPSQIFSQFGLLQEGDVIGAIDSGDYDVYIVNEHGFKRLFLNPTIFEFYGHLFGFQSVKEVFPVVRDSFVTSGLFRNCESDDEKVFGLTVYGEDVGTLHWVDTSGEQAVIDDPDFFKKVFCINQKEFDWYPKGQKFSSVNDIPNYSRESLTRGDVPQGGLLGGVTGGGVSRGSSGGGGGSSGGGGGSSGGGGGGGSPTTTPVPPSPACGGSGRIPGFIVATCLMPEDLAGTTWNLVDDATGEILNEVICSVAVCGRDGEHRAMGLPVGATYIQTSFNVGYSGRYFTNGVWETNRGGIVQPGSDQITGL